MCLYLSSGLEAGCVEALEIRDRNTDRACGGVVCGDSSWCCGLRAALLDAPSEASDHSAGRGDK